jgi:conjugal transfer pilus assembly protein TraK
MKFRISPAAAAVFLAAGLFTSGLRAASAPAAIPFENDAAFNVTLSNTNPSKVVVDGELITSISGPTGAYDQSQTEDGALILSPLVGQNFTLFIQTDHGSSLSLNVRPQPGNGKTLRFTPMSPPLRKNDDAKAWEEGQTYEKTLVALSRAVVNGQVPDDYREYPVSRMPAYTPASDVRLTPERQFVGNHLRGSLPDEQPGQHHPQPPRARFLAQGRPGRNAVAEPALRWRRRLCLDCVFR